MLIGCAAKDESKHEKALYYYVPMFLPELKTR